MSCAGNQFCGTVPLDLDGIVRSFGESTSDQEVLANVTRFSIACGNLGKHKTSLSQGAITGEHFVLVHLCWSMMHLRE